MEVKRGEAHAPPVLQSGSYSAPLPEQLVLPPGRRLRHGHRASPGGNGSTAQPLTAAVASDVTVHLALLTALACIDAAPSVASHPRFEYPPKPPCLPPRVARAGDHMPAHLARRPYVPPSQPTPDAGSVVERATVRMPYLHDDVVKRLERLVHAYPVVAPGSSVRARRVAERLGRQFQRESRFDAPPYLADWPEGQSVVLVSSQDRHVGRGQLFGGAVGIEPAAVTGSLESRSREPKDVSNQLCADVCPAQCPKLSARDLRRDLPCTLPVGSAHQTADCLYGHGTPRSIARGDARLCLRLRCAVRDRLHQRQRGWWSRARRSPTAGAAAPIPVSPWSGACWVRAQRTRAADPAAAACRSADRSNRGGGRRSGHHRLTSRRSATAPRYGTHRRRADASRSQ